MTQFALPDGGIGPAGPAGPAGPPGMLAHGKYVGIAGPQFIATPFKPARVQIAGMLGFITSYTFATVDMPGGSAMFQLGPLTLFPPIVFFAPAGFTVAGFANVIGATYYWTADT